MRFKRSFTDPVPANKEKGFADKGIATYRGTARFVADNALEVAGERLEARHVVIASGAEPVPLPIQGAEHVTTAIAFSSSTSYRGGCSLSATPTHRSSSPTSRHGPAPRWSYSIVASGRSRRSIRVWYRCRSADNAEIHGRSETFDTDLVVHGAGRAPGLERLHLEGGGVHSPGSASTRPRRTNSDSTSRSRSTT